MRFKWMSVVGICKKLRIAHFVAAQIHSRIVVSISHLNTEQKKYVFCSCTLVDAMSLWMDTLFLINSVIILALSCISSVSS